MNMPDGNTAAEISRDLPIRAERDADYLHDLKVQREVDDEAERKRNEGAMCEALDRVHEAVIALNFAGAWK